MVIIIMQDIDIEDVDDEVRARVRSQYGRWSGFVERHENTRTTAPGKSLPARRAAAVTTLPGQNSEFIGLFQDTSLPMRISAP